MTNQVRDNIKKALSFILDENKPLETQEALLENYIDNFLDGRVEGTVLDFLESADEYIESMVKSKKIKSSVKGLIKAKDKKQEEKTRKIVNDELGKKEKSGKKATLEGKRVGRVFKRRLKQKLYKELGKGPAESIMARLNSGDGEEHDDVKQKVAEVLQSGGRNIADGSKHILKTKLQNKALKESVAASKLADKLRDLIIDEYDAVNGYDEVIRKAEEEDDAATAKILADIRDEEKVHIGELEAALKKYDSSFDEKKEEGTKEVEELQEAKSAETKFKKATTELENYKNSISKEQHELEAKDLDSKLSKKYAAVDKQIPALQNERIEKLKAEQLQEADIEELQKLQNDAKKKEDDANLRAKIAGEKADDQVYGRGRYEEEEDKALADAQAAKEERERLEKETPDLHTHKNGQMSLFKEKDKK